MVRHVQWDEVQHGCFTNQSMASACEHCVHKTLEGLVAVFEYRCVMIEMVFDCGKIALAHVEHAGALCQGRVRLESVE
jgi:hypothetical protein